MSGVNNSSLYEADDSLNARYATALLPLSIIFGFLAFSGLVGNTITLLVFFTSREYKRGKFRVFAIFLGIIDLMTCITIIPAEIAKHRHYFAFEDGTICKAKCFLNVYGTSASALTLLLISVERYQRVCKPLGAQLRTCTVIRLCFALLLFSLLLSCPAALMCGITELSMKNVHGGSTKVYICLIDEKYRFSVWRIIYKASVFILLLLVSLTCIVMYIFVGRAIFKSRGKRLGSYSSRIRGTEGDDKPDLKKEKDEEDQNDVELTGQVAVKETIPGQSSTGSRNIDENSRKPSSRSTDSERIGRFPYKTIIWFVLTIIFIVTYVVYAALSFNPRIIIDISPRLHTLYSFFLRLYIINSVINPMIYALLDSRFRRSCKQLMRCKFLFG